MHTRWFEEFTVGDTLTTRGATLTESRIVDFALTYDPQQMHINKAAADEGMFGGLIASGFQTLALSFRLFLETGAIERSNIVGPGLDEVRWLVPVKPGDTLTAEIEVLEARPSRSRPDRGSVRFGVTVANQHAITVLTYQALTILRKAPDGDMGR